MEEWERLLDELRAELTLREHELELLHEIDLRLLNEENSHRELFSFIIKRTQKLLSANHTTVLLRRSTFLEPMYSNLMSLVGQRVPISTSLTGLCLETGETISIPDITKSEHAHRYAPLRGYRGVPMRSLLATPITIRGTTVGVLNAESRVPGAFKPVHERVAEAVAGQIAIALQRTQVLDSTVLFADLDRQMFASGDSEEATQAALERIMAELQRLEHVGYTGAQIMFLRDQDNLEIVNSTNPPDVGLIIPTASSVSGRAVLRRETVVVGDVNKDRDYKRLLGDTIRSEIAVPLIHGEEELVIGVLNVESEEEYAFNDFYQIILESFAEKVKPLLTITKLRADVAEALEMRTADDLLVAVGDQTTHVIHLISNTVGAMRLRIMELQDQRKSGELTDEFLDDALDSLLELAKRTLRMPDDVKLGKVGQVDVNECVTTAIQKMKIDENVALEVELGANIPALPLYSFDIVVQNLIQNALDAMPNGGKLSISTSAAIHPWPLTGYFHFVVGDTGTGIPPDIQRRIFDLNFTTKDKRGRGLGLGLGLWWVRNFIRRARGDISIRSVVGAGTEFTVKIPIDRSGEAEHPAMTQSAD
jgi:signal transduction histidine kinase